MEATDVWASHSNPIMSSHSLYEEMIPWPQKCRTGPLQDRVGPRAAVNSASVLGLGVEVGEAAAGERRFDFRDWCRNASQQNVPRELGKFKVRRKSFCLKYYPGELKIRFWSSLVLFSGCFFSSTNLSATSMWVSPHRSWMQLLILYF